MTGSERPRRRQSVARSFAVAWAGVLHAVRAERNVQFHLAATALVVGLGMWLGLQAIEWAVIGLTCGVVWTAELLNTAIEAAVDLSSPQEHELARIAKDVSSGAVLVAAFAAVVVGLLILGPPLWERLGG